MEYYFFWHEFCFQMNFFFLQNFALPIHPDRYGWKWREFSPRLSLSRSQQLYNRMHSLSSTNLSLVKFSPDILNDIFTCKWWRRDDLMVSALGSGASCPGLSPGRGTFCCLLGLDTLLWPRVPPSFRGKWCQNYRSKQYLSLTLSLWILYR